MDPSDITHIEIDVEARVSEAVETAKKAFDALNLLLVHSWTQQLVERVSSSAAWHFKVNQEELAALLVDKFRSEIHTVNNPNQTSWSDCLECWSRTVVANFSKNQLKHNKVVKKHELFVQSLNTKCKRDSLPIWESVVETPEEQLLQKEEGIIWESRLQETRAIALRVVSSLQPEDRRITYLWSQGLKPEEIARETQKSPQTVYRRLKAIQKTVAAQIGIEQTDELKPLLKGLRELFSHSLSVG